MIRRMLCVFAATLALFLSVGTANAQWGGWYQPRYSYWYAPAPYYGYGYGPGYGGYAPYGAYNPYYGGSYYGYGYSPTVTEGANLGGAIAGPRGANLGAAIGGIVNGGW
ncbi:MAG TPA: hypothetical protein VHV77_18725 [Pirellulales bacterium]|nr:hypothetical protein [Pirellulales bacterium]